MSARYYTFIAQDLLDDAASWESSGLRVIEQGILTSPGVRLCLLEDDEAPEDLNGRTVDPSLSRGLRHPGDLAESTWVSGRRVIA